MLWAHRGNEFCLDGGKAQESPRDAKAADVSVFLRTTYVLLLGVTENGFCYFCILCMQEALLCSALLGCGGHKESTSCSS